MRRTMMKSKIHRAAVTGADLRYVGSITLDAELMRLADVLEHEQVHVLDLDNGARFETYAIPGEPGSGEVVLNGAAARLVQPGDTVILITYAQYDEAEVRAHTPRIVHVDAHNRPVGAAPARDPADGNRAARGLHAARVTVADVTRPPVRHPT